MKRLVLLVALALAACQTSGNLDNTSETAGWAGEAEQCVAERYPASGMMMTTGGALISVDKGRLLRTCRCEVEWIESEFTAHGLDADHWRQIEAAAVSGDEKAQEIVGDAWIDAQLACD